MNPLSKTRALPSDGAPWSAGQRRSLRSDNPAAAKVLRNTYALLSLTLLFSAGVASVVDDNYRGRLTTTMLAG